MLRSQLAGIQGKALGFTTAPLQHTGLQCWKLTESGSAAGLHIAPELGWKLLLLPKPFSSCGFSSLCLFVPPEERMGEVETHTVNLLGPRARARRAPHYGNKKYFPCAHTERNTIRPKYLSLRVCFPIYTRERRPDWWKYSWEGKR